MPRRNVVHINGDELNANKIRTLPVVGDQHYANEVSLPTSKWTVVKSYCPVYCQFGCGATLSTTKTTTKATTTMEITTVAPQAVFNEIVENDTTFGGLILHLLTSKNITAEDGVRRYEIYAETKSLVDEQNEKFDRGESSFQMTTNAFSVMVIGHGLIEPTNLDRLSFRRYTTTSCGKDGDEIAPLGLKITGIPSLKSVNRSKLTKRSAESVDWRSYLETVSDQGSCGGCWAFSLVGSIEGFLSIRDVNVSRLSVQQMLDCDRTVNAEYGVANAGCAGGYFQVAADYISKTNLDASSDYPFLGSSRKSCHTVPLAIAPTIASFDTGFVEVTTSSEYDQLAQDMQERLSKGPVSVGMAVSDDIYKYSSGVYDGDCGTVINHAVVLVGYTSDYWIVRNSWGSAWGENGYIRVSRSQGMDRCMLTQYWAQPTTIGLFPLLSGAVNMIPPTQGPGTSRPTIEPASITNSTERVCCDVDYGCCSDCSEDECEDDDDYPYIISTSSTSFTTQTTSTQIPTQRATEEVTTTTEKVTTEQTKPTTPTTTTKAATTSTSKTSTATKTSTTTVLTAKNHGQMNKLCKQLNIDC